MKYIVYTISLLLIAVAAAGKGDKRIVFAGDAGRNDAVLRAIREQVQLDTNTTVILLGSEKLKNGESLTTILDKQMAILKGTGAQAIYVPGHGDWKQRMHGGEDALAEEEAYILKAGDERVRLVPQNGCPGPESIALDDNTQLIIMDSQWWLQERDKPGVESGCANRTDAQVIDDLKSLVSENRNKLVLFISHHPLHSTGVRSGSYGLKQHLFPLTDIRGLQQLYLPLPVIGSLYPIARSLVVSRQDMAHIRYQELISSVDDMLKEHPHLLRVAGHEDIQELYHKQGQYYIVSGAGSKSGRARRIAATPYASNATGFSVVDISADKEVTVSFYEVSGTNVKMAYTSKLFNFAAMPPVAADTAGADSNLPDRVVAAVNPRFADASPSKRWLQGNNYREVWATPVKLKVLRMQQEHGGLTIDGQGGGNQTLSIRLKNAEGKTWSLRSINKDPVRIIPENFRNTFARDVVQDMTSASYPYAAAPATALASALGFASPDVSYYYVPNDTALGYYRPALAHTVVMMEERDPSLYGEKTVSTWKVFNDKQDTGLVTIDQPAYLKARMLDVMIGDFDRHYDQYKWGERKEGSLTVYYPVPKDRDQAFFYSDALIIKLYASLSMPYLKGLKRDIHSITSYGLVARDVDGLFLNGLDRNDWQHELQQFASALSDSTIDSAVRQMPPEIYASGGAGITDKLKSRRDLLKAGKGIEYYRFLARKVNVTGSNKGETFDVSAVPEGTRVQVTQRDSARGLDAVVYNRIFREGETKEIRLYGFNGDDLFTIRNNVKSSIRIRAIGGMGNDRFDMNGRMRNLVYDDAAEHNMILNGRRTTNMISGRKDVNSYTFRENTYNSIQIPTINLGYNGEDGILAGLGFTITRQGFRQSPYASQHRFTSLTALANEAYQLRYRGTVNDIYRHYDLQVNAGFINPNLTNFFGFGNETIKDLSKPVSYYRVRYSSTYADAAIRKRFADNRFAISVGPSFYYYYNHKDRNEGRILAQPDRTGIDTSGAFVSKSYVGGKAGLRFYSIDNALLPTRGIEWNTDFTALGALDASARPLTSLRSNLTLYAPVSSNKRFVFVLHAGGGHIFSRSPEYFQALTLGSNNYLRGYRKTRFSGTGMAYVSTELRARLLRLQSRFVAGDMGLIGFNDLGRVWVTQQVSHTWHHGYGGGIYFSPYNAVLISALVARSAEETLFNISVGTRININFGDPSVVEQ